MPWSEYKDLNVVWLFVGYLLREVGIMSLWSMTTLVGYFQAGYRGFESRSGRGNFQTISTPPSTCPGLSIKWTGRHLVTDSHQVCRGDPWKQGCTYMYITIAAASMCQGCLVALRIRTTTMITFFSLSPLELAWFMKEQQYWVTSRHQRVSIFSWMTVFTEECVHI